MKFNVGGLVAALTIGVLGVEAAEQLGLGRALRLPFAAAAEDA